MRQYKVLFRFSPLSYPVDFFNAIRWFTEFHTLVSGFFFSIEYEDSVPSGYSGHNLTQCP